MNILKVCHAGNVLSGIHDLKARSKAGFRPEDCRNDSFGANEFVMPEMFYPASTV